MAKQIQKTNRIRLKNATIYTSCEMVQQLRPRLTRLQQILVPNKGEYYNLLTDLHNAVQSHPEHFPESSKVIIREYFHA